jgi:hypothetical protein
LKQLTKKIWSCYGTTPFLLLVGLILLTLFFLYSQNGGTTWARAYNHNVPSSHNFTAAPVTPVQHFPLSPASASASVIFGNSGGSSSSNGNNNSSSSSSDHLEPMVASPRPGSTSLSAEDLSGVDPCALEGGGAIVAVPPSPALPLPDRLNRPKTPNISNPYIKPAFNQQRGISVRQGIKIPGLEINGTAGVRFDETKTDQGTVYRANSPFVINIDAKLGIDTVNIKSELNARYDPNSRQFVTSGYFQPNGTIVFSRNVKLDLKGPRVNLNQDWKPTVSSYTEAVLTVTSGNGTRKYTASVQVNPGANGGEPQYTISIKAELKF